MLCPWIDPSVAEIEKSLKLARYFQDLQKAVDRKGTELFPALLLTGLQLGFYDRGHALRSVTRAKFREQDEEVAARWILERKLRAGRLEGRRRGPRSAAVRDGGPSRTETVGVSGSVQGASITSSSGSLLSNALDIRVGDF